MKKFTLFLLTLSLTLSLSPKGFASFSDVPASHLNYDAINYLQAKGMVGGYPDGTYKADITINRVEFTKIITEAMFTDAEISSCTTSVFSDVPANEWFTKYVCIAEKNNIIDGYPDGTFQSANQINVAEASKIIVNAFKYPVQEDAVTWYKPYVLKLEELKALPTTLTGFTHQVTRGEMAEEMFRLDAKVFDKASTTYANLEAGVKGKEFTVKEVMEKAVEYHNKLVDVHNKSLTEYTDYTQLQMALEDLEDARKDVVEAVKKVKTQIANLPSFQGDFSLKEAFLKDLDALIDLLNQEEKELIEVMIAFEANESEANEAKVNTLYEEINELNAEAYEALNAVQEAFAKKYGFELYNQNTEVIAYNNELVAIQTNALSLKQDYVTLAEQTTFEEGFESLEIERQATIVDIEALKQTLIDKGDYKGDNSLYEAFVDFIDVLIGTLENEEKALIDVWTEMAQNPDDIPQNLEQQEADLLKAIEQKENQAYEVLTEAQKNFAEKHDYDLPQQSMMVSHTFYTSSHPSSELYYCDTDSAWKNLSPQYLQSYDSESKLLEVYPNKTLNEPCK